MNDNASGGWKYGPWHIANLDRGLGLTWCGKRVARYLGNERREVAPTEHSGSVCADCVKRQAEDRPAARGRR
jgi:hypothetical protein